MLDWESCSLLHVLLLFVVAYGGTPHALYHIILSDSFGSKFSLVLL